MASCQSAVLHQEEYGANTDSFFFLPLGSAWGHFYVSANVLHIYSFFGHTQLHVTAKFATSVVFHVYSILFLASLSYT